MTSGDAEFKVGDWVEYAGTEYTLDGKGRIRAISRLPDLTPSAEVKFGVDRWILPLSDLKVLLPIVPDDVVVDDSVNHPQHYMNHPCGLEIIEITKHHNYTVGNALKYLFRHPFKGNPVQDLEKAVAYIQFEIDRVKAGGKLDRT